MSLDPIQRHLLAAMKPGVRHARSDLMAATGITVLQWKQAVGALVSSGHLVRTGQKRGTRYHLTPEGILSLDASPPDLSPLIAPVAPAPPAPSNPNELCDEAHALLGIMRPGAQHARAELLERVELSVSQWNRAIRQLMEAGLIERQGQRRASRYHLTEGGISASSSTPQTTTPTEETSTPPGVTVRSMPGVRRRRRNDDPTPDEPASAPVPPAAPTVRKRPKRPTIDTSPPPPRPLSISGPPTMSPPPSHRASRGRRDSRSSVSLSSAPPRPSARPHSSPARPASPPQTPAPAPAPIPPRPVTIDPAFLRSREQASARRSSPGAKQALKRNEVLRETLRSQLEIDADADVILLMAHQKLPDLFWHSISGLSNANGGQIILGAKDRWSDDRVLLRSLGEPGVQELREDICAQSRSRETLNRVVLELSQLHVEVLEGHQLLRVEIPPAGPERRPVFIGSDSFSKHPDRGTFLFEKGQGIRKCRRREVRDMWAEWVAPLALAYENEPDQSHGHGRGHFQKVLARLRERGVLPSHQAEVSNEDASHAGEGLSGASDDGSAVSQGELALNAEVEPSVEVEPSADDSEEALMALSLKARERSRLPISEVLEIVLALCARRPLNEEALCQLLSRSAPSVQRYLRELLATGRLRMVSETGCYVTA